MFHVNRWPHYVVFSSLSDFTLRQRITFKGKSLFWSCEQWGEKEKWEFRLRGITLLCRTQINISSNIYSTCWLPGGNFYVNNYTDCCRWKFLIWLHKRDKSEDTLEALDLQCTYLLCSFKLLWILFRSTDSQLHEKKFEIQMQLGSFRWMVQKLFF